MKHLNEAYKSNILQELNRKFLTYNKFIKDVVDEDKAYTDKLYDFAEPCIDYVQEKFKTLKHYIKYDSTYYKKTLFEMYGDVNNITGVQRNYVPHNAEAIDTISDNDRDKYNNLWSYLQTSCSEFLKTPISDLDFIKLDSYRELTTSQYKNVHKLVIIYNRKLNTIVFGHDTALLGAIKLCDGIPFNKDNIDTVAFEEMYNDIVYNNTEKLPNYTTINKFLHILYEPVKALHVFRKVYYLFYTESLNVVIAKHKDFLNPDDCDIYVSILENPIMHKFKKQQLNRTEYKAYLNDYQDNLKNIIYRRQKLLKLYRFLNNPNTKLGMLMKVNTQVIRLQNILYNAVNDVHKGISYDKDTLTQNNDIIKSLLDIVIDNRHFELIADICKFYNNNGSLNFQDVIENPKIYEDANNALYRNIRTELMYIYDWLSQLKNVITVIDIENKKDIQNKVLALKNECDKVKEYFKIDLN